MLLAGKIAVITGCNRGIGKAILEKFSENGANIFACVRKIDDDFLSLIKKIQKENNNEIFPIELDLSNKENVKEAGKKILSYEKDIDILINNAGSISTSLFQMTSVDKYKELFEINFYSQILFTQTILKSIMKTKRGNIVFISSSSGIDGNEGRSAYSSSKAAIIAQSKVLSRELGRYNIKVNTVAPGLTNTDMMKKTPQKIIDEALERTPLNKAAEPSEVADTVLFLASSQSNHITGETIYVTGGM